MNTLQLKYIPTNTTFSRQGGENYTSTSLIDGCHIKATNTQNYKSYTMNIQNLNLDHYPISLKILQNTVISRTPTSPLPPTR
jgi:hypothetical protein